MKLYILSQMGHVINIWKSRGDENVSLAFLGKDFGIRHAGTISMCFCWLLAKRRLEIYMESFTKMENQSCTEAK